jgi:hypothetical protein
MKIEHNIQQKRVEANLQYHLQEGKVAFYLGAGIDNILVKGSNLLGGKIINAPGWAEFVYKLTDPKLSCEDVEELFKKDSDEIKEWKSYIKMWPAELATIFRLMNGDELFLSSIKEQFNNPNYHPNLKDAPTKALCSLLSYSNVIVTTNYSNYIDQAIRVMYKNKISNNTLQIISLDREDLDCFIFPEPKKKNEIKTIYIIHIHGRPSEKSFPILDAWGYNSAEYDSPDYLSLLNTLFRERHVITIGTSWEDIPIREISNKLNRKYPYLDRSNLFIFFPKMNIDQNNIPPMKAWADSIKAIYGMNIHIVKDIEEETTLFKKLSEIKHQPKIASSLNSISEYLDSIGDYESNLQQKWLLSIGQESLQNASESEKMKNGVRLLLRKLKNSFKYKCYDQWIIAAKVERHLRHHIWLYPPERGKRDSIREEIWKLLYQDFKNFSLHQIEDLPKELLFHFLTGNYEIMSKPFDIKLPPDIFNRIFAERLEKCKRIWLPVPEEEDALENRILELNDLAKELLDCEWESMASKTLTDKAWLSAIKLNKIGKGDKDGFGKIRSELLSDIKRAEGIAKLTGCYRRRVKVDVLKSIWGNDLTENRNRLLSQLRSGFFETAENRLEPGLRNAIGLALVVNQKQYEDSGIRLGKITKDYSEILAEVALDKKEVFQDDNINHWKPVIPSDFLN